MALKIVRHIEKINNMRLFALFAIAVGLCHAQRTDGSFDRTLNVTGFVDLDLATDAGGIHVIPGPPGTVRIRGILKAGDNWFPRGDVESRIRELERHPPIEQTGNSIRVAVRGQSSLRGISMRLEVEPRETAACGRAPIPAVSTSAASKARSSAIPTPEVSTLARSMARSGQPPIREASTSAV